jgi:hypothetical protein
LSTGLCTNYILVNIITFAQRKWLAAALDHPPLVAAISSHLKINCNPQNADHAYEIDDI